MYWLPKLHKAPIGARFINASKNCSTKPLSVVISKTFKMLFKNVENFYNISTFYSSCKNFWVVENSLPIIEKVNLINIKIRAKRFLAMIFVLCIPQHLIICYLNLFQKQNILFVSNRKFVVKLETSIFSTSKDLGLIEAITFLIKNSYFTIGNMVFNQDFEIPMGIVPAPFWTNLFLYFLSLSILFLKNQLELINTTLLVNS